MMQVRFFSGFPNRKGVCFMQRPNHRFKLTLLPLIVAAGFVCVSTASFPAVCLAEDTIEQPGAEPGLPPVSPQQPSAQNTSAGAASLQAVLASLDNAGNQLQEITPAKVNAARQQLVNAMTKLEPLLGADPAGWKKYLKWDELQAAIDLKNDADYDTLEAAYQQYARNHQGLELDEFRRTRSALRRYIDLSYNSQEGFLDAARLQLKSLTDHIQAYIKQPNLEDAHFIGLYAGWLESAEQLPDVVSNIRRQFQQPNLYAQISAYLVKAGLARSSSSTDAVNDVILGTRITGTAHTMGDVNVQLIPSPDAVGLEFQFRGQTLTKAIGRQSLVTVHTTSTVDFVAKKRVFIRTGRDELWRTGVAATLDSNLDCVDVASPFKCKPVARLTQPVVRRVALKRVEENRPASNEIARQRARGRLASSFDKQAVPSLQDARKQINTKLLATLRRIDEYPQQLQLSTTEQGVQVQAVHFDSYGTGATTTAPEINGQHDIVLRLHESMIANAGRRRLAGKEFDSNAGGGLENQLGELQRFITFRDKPKPAKVKTPDTPPQPTPAPMGKSPQQKDDAAPPEDDAVPPAEFEVNFQDDAAPPGDDAAPPGDDAAPPGDDAMPPGVENMNGGEGVEADGQPDGARVTLASALPLAIYFNNDGIRVAIRLSRIQQGDRDIQDIVEISAVYKPQPFNGTFRLVKHGDLKVKFPDPVISRIEQAAIQSLLKKRIDSMFKAYVEFKPLPPPEQFKGKIGELQISAFESRNGWLTLGLSAEKNTGAAIAPQ